MTKVKRLLAGLSVVALAALAGCGGGESAAAPSVDPSNSPRAPAPTATRALPMAPDFTLDAVREVDGALEPVRFTLSERRGNATILYFSFVG